MKIFIYHFLSVLDEWTPENGLVTAAFKIRRLVFKVSDKIPSNKRQNLPAGQACVIVFGAWDPNFFAWKYASMATFYQNATKRVNHNISPKCVNNDSLAKFANRSKSDNFHQK